MRKFLTGAPRPLPDNTGKASARVRHAVRATENPSIGWRGPTQLDREKRRQVQAAYGAKTLPRNIFGCSIARNLVIGVKPYRL